MRARNGSAGKNGSGSRALREYTRGAAFVYIRVLLYTDTCVCGSLRVSLLSECMTRRIFKRARVTVRVDSAAITLLLYNQVIFLWPGHVVLIIIFIRLNDWYRKRMMLVYLLLIYRLLHAHKNVSQ